MMATLSVSKKASLVGSWSEDIVTDEILNNIATRAKTEKGKKLKVKVNEVGIRLTRARLLQESQFKLFPIKNVQTAMQSPDFPKCVMLILSDPNKKYKIVALRLETEADATHLTSVIADIQNKVQSENVEFKKRDNGNWTLRGRTDHNANRQLLEIFNEHKQANGDLIVSSANGGMTHVPVLDASVVNNSGPQHESAYIQQGREVIADKIYKNDSDDDDEYVIETEVTTHPHVKTKILVDQEVPKVQHATTKLEHVAIPDNTDGVWVSGKPSKHSDISILPSRPVVYGATSARVVPPEPVVYGATSARVVPPEPVVYGATSARVVPPEPVVYRATSSRVVAPEPAIYSMSSRSYQTNAPIMTTTSAGYYTNPWAHRQVSRESSLVPFRIDANPANVKFDQQSLMSNTSRMSRFSRMRSSELSIPTTVQRSIEHVYPRPVVILRRGHEHRPRPASYHAYELPRPVSYHAHELRIYQEDEREAGMLL